MEDKLYDIPTTKSEAYDFVLNQVVWIEQPVPHILESSNYATMYPVFAKYGVDCKPANLQRLLREAYDRQVAALKSVLSRRKVHLVIDFRRKMTTSYVGITITSKSSKPKMLGVVDFDDGSPEAATWFSRVAEILREYDLMSGEKLKSVTFCNKAGDNGQADFMKKLHPTRKEMNKCRDDEIRRKTFDELKKVCMRFFQKSDNFFPSNTEIYENIFYSKDLKSFQTVTRIDRGSESQ